MQIGKGFVTGKYCRLETQLIEKSEGDNKLLVIGDFVEMNDSCHITATKSVRIGDHVLMASRVYISDVSHGHYEGMSQSSPETPPNQRPLVAKAVIIENNVWLGEGVCVLPGVTIGSGAIIGANAVVTKDIPAHCIAVGIPARVIKKYNESHGIWENI